MMRRPFVVMTALACALAVSTACRSEEVKVDRSPLPTVAAPPYLCDHIPLKAVELMTGVRDPVVRGHFDFTTDSGIGIGSCVIRRPGGDRPVVLMIDLTPGGYVGEIEERIEDGASPMPEIAPGAIGSYFKDVNSRNNAAFAMLVRGKAEINIQLERGVAGRDNAADVLALMRLIAPKLLTDASAPSAKTASPSPSPTKE